MTAETREEDTGGVSSGSRWRQYSVRGNVGANPHRGRKAAREWGRSRQRKQAGSLDARTRHRRDRVTVYHAACVRRCLVSGELGTGGVWHRILGPATAILAACLFFAVLMSEAVLLLPLRGVHDRHRAGEVRRDQLARCQTRDGARRSEGRGPGTGAGRVVRPSCLSGRGWTNSGSAADPALVRAIRTLSPDPPPFVGRDRRRGARRKHADLLISDAQVMTQMESKVDRDGPAGPYCGWMAR